MKKTWHANGVKNHLVAELRDGEETLIVYKWWRRRHKIWEYECETKGLVELQTQIATNWRRMLGQRR